jgi:hypothetical protein
MTCDKDSCTYVSKGKSYQLNVKICKCKVRQAITGREKASRQGGDAKRTSKNVPKRQSSQFQQKKQTRQNNLEMRDSDDDSTTDESEEDENTNNAYEEDDEEYVDLVTEGTAQNKAEFEHQEDSQDESECDREDLEKEFEEAYGTEVHFCNARFSQINTLEAFDEPDHCLSKRKPGTPMYEQGAPQKIIKKI